MNVDYADNALWNAPQAWGEGFSAKFSRWNSGAKRKRSRLRKTGL
jgi:hypothetical protein